LSAGGGGGGGGGGGSGRCNEIRAITFIPLALLAAAPTRPAARRAHTEPAAGSGSGSGSGGHGCPATSERHWPPPDSSADGRPDWRLLMAAYPPFISLGAPKWSAIVAAE